MIFCPSVDLDLTLRIRWSIKEWEVTILQFEILIMKLKVKMYIVKFAVYLGKCGVKGVEYCIFLSVQLFWLI